MLRVLPVFFLIAFSRAAVIWECDSWPSNDPLGGCSWTLSSISWGEGNIAAVPDPAGRAGNALRVFYPAGSWVQHPSGGDMKGGTNFYARDLNTLPEHTNLILEYEIYLSPDFPCVKGGKQPGLFGGTGSCSGGGTDTTCWSSRFMWRDSCDGEAYAYIPNETDDWFCSNPDVHCDYNYGHSLGRGSFRFAKGSWHTVAQQVRLNQIGAADGYLRIFYDGVEVYEIVGLTFRDTTSVKVDQIFFSTFFGGSTQDWATPSDCYSYYRHFTLSTP